MIAEPRIDVDPREPSCDCIQRANETLAAAGENTVLDTALWENLETGDQMVKIRIPTLKADPTSRKRMCPISARFCPLCGVKYGWKPLPAAVEMRLSGVAELPGLDGAE